MRCIVFAPVEIHTAAYWVTKRVEYLTVSYNTTKKNRNIHKTTSSSKKNTLKNHQQQSMRNRQISSATPKITHLSRNPWFKPQLPKSHKIPREPKRLFVTYSDVFVSINQHVTWGRICIIFTSFKQTGTLGSKTSSRGIIPAWQHRLEPRYSPAATF